jgi:hypothetical protein
MVNAGRVNSQTAKSARERNMSERGIETMTAKIRTSDKKAIETKYVCPTNFRGSRVKATDHDGNSITLPWDCALNSGDNHAATAAALCAKMGWRGQLVGGSFPGSMVWVFVA